MIMQGGTPSSHNTTHERGGWKRPEKMVLSLSHLQICCESREVVNGNASTIYIGYVGTHMSSQNPQTPLVLELKFCQ